MAVYESAATPAGWVACVGDEPPASGTRLCSLVQDTGRRVAEILWFAL